MTLVSVSPKDQDDSGLWCYSITVNPPEGYPHPRWGVQGIQYTVYSIQYTLPWGPVPPQGGCTYTIYSVEYTSPWVPSPLGPLSQLDLCCQYSSSKISALCQFLYLSWTSEGQHGSGLRCYCKVLFCCRPSPSSLHFMLRLAKFSVSVICYLSLLSVRSFSRRASLLSSASA